jgi:hypothetical protein
MSEMGFPDGAGPRPAGRPQSTSLRLAGRVEVLRRLIPMPLPTWTAARYPRSIRPIGGGVRGDARATR